eukprot:6187817-Pleurochrysis_carterae.AAC.2
MRGMPLIPATPARMLAWGIGFASSAACWRAVGPWVGRTVWRAEVWWAACRDVLFTARCSARLAVGWVNGWELELGAWGSDWWGAWWGACRDAFTCECGCDCTRECECA